ncbi:MAG TPA: protocadherin, partial [Planctomycetota bacterium]|nr:protocadherin [Planctomycetota bacterium]
VYEGPYVYLGGERVATREVWVDDAYRLADIEYEDLTPVDSDFENDLAENWKPLGLFMLVRDDEARASTPLYLQLAVSKNGEIGGTYHNDAKGSTLPVAGRVDARNQRVAFHVGDDKTTVVETGMYNLTQDSAPAQIHFGREKSENWLLIRLKDPPSPGTNR